MLPHSHDIRQKAYEMWRSGVRKIVISQTLGVDYDTLLGWAKRFSQEGESAVYTHYSRCGRPPRGNEPVKERALALRLQHPDWGAEYIHLNLLREFPEDAPLVKPNQIRKWMTAGGLIAKKTQLPRVKADWARRPLEVIQVDAKEQLAIKDGTPCCYLNFIDEYTGAELGAFVFPLFPHQPSPY